MFLRHEISRAKQRRSLPCKGSLIQHPNGIHPPATYCRLMARAPAAQVAE